MLRQEVSHGVLRGCVGDRFVRGEGNGWLSLWEGPASALDRCRSSALALLNGNPHSCESNHTNACNMHGMGGIKFFPACMQA